MVARRLAALLVAATALVLSTAGPASAGYVCQRVPPPNGDDFCVILP